MTIEEAKVIFINRGFIEVDGGSIYDPDKWRESVKVISDWLEQEPCEDAISRQAVLEGKVIHQSCDGLEIINSYAVPVEYIEQLPPVTPQPKTGHWVPVSERLPLLRGLYKISDDVLVTNGYENYLGYLVERKGKIFWHYYGSDIEVGINDNDDDVIAWMPMPEPYKEVEE